MQHLDVRHGCGRAGVRDHSGKKQCSPRTPLAGPLVSYLIIFSVDQGQLELELRGINGEHPRTTLPIQAIHIVALHPRDIDG